ncbi:MAG: helix-turn-helix domain-containing protein [Acidobacteriota bacterium]|nr:helix-turn-helix domain-containing protein [Acidobacteriota bacterium]
MKILHIEDWSEATNAFIQELHAATGCSIEHAGTFDEGLLKIEGGRGSIDVVLYTVAPTSSDVLMFPERVRAMADEALFRSPHLILLASAPLAPPCAAKCMDRQVLYLLRHCPRQIVETVKALLWKIRSSKPGPTIRIEFRGGYYRFFICGLTTSEEIRVSAQIGRLLLLLTRGFRSYTVEMLADELGISRRSVKKYMRDLRVILKSTQKKICGCEPVVDVVWMERGTGGTLCGLRVNAAWG